MDSPASHSPESLPAFSRRCENCGAELRGEHCYACGQPTKGLVRHFSSILGDFADTVFNVDGRIFRTLGPLLLKPGYLSIEYFAGRRVRYVSPVRLFVFTCLIAFLATRFSVDPGDSGPLQMQRSDFSRASSVAEVERLRDDSIRQLDKAIRDSGEIAGLGAGLQAARESIQQHAAERITELEAAKSATDGGDASAPATAGASKDSDAPSFSFNDKPFHPEHNPVTVEWLPKAANDQLNQWIQRALDNSTRVKANPRLLSDAFLDFLPQTLFVLLPVFALLLKLAYLFKRRLYMEHLIVALHSHAFLSLATLLLALATLARTALGEGLLYSGLGWFEFALVVWMPLYLLIMQKRVYGQGWILTILKYGLLGTAYSMLISLGLVVTVLLSLVAL